MTRHFMQTMRVGIFRVPHQGFMCTISESALGVQGKMFSVFEGNISCPRLLARKRSSQGLFFPAEERGCLPKQIFAPREDPHQAVFKGVAASFSSASLPSKKLHAPSWTRWLKVFRQLPWIVQSWLVRLV